MNSTKLVLKIFGWFLIGIASLLTVGMVLDIAGNSNNDLFGKIFTNVVFIGLLFVAPLTLFGLMLIKGSSRMTKSTSSAHIVKGNSMTLVLFLLFIGFLGLIALLLGNITG